jgi:hypothetical protein
MNLVEIELKKELEKARGECNQLNNQIMLKEKKVFEVERKGKEL